jgi:4'-phosphopantetheinyl transferase
MATLDLTYTPVALRREAPPLAADAAHVWRLRLDGAGDDPGACLSDAERRRAASMKHTGARASFVTTRIALRRILAAYTGVDAERLEIVIDARGKPSLDAHGAIHFNVSHSGGVGLVAVTRAATIGVDVETIRPLPRLDDIATRFFAPAEAAVLRALPEAERGDAFHACWTRKEAFVKAEGSGIAHAMAGFEVSVGPHEPARLLSIGNDALSAEAWTLHAFRPSPDAWGAVCIGAPGIGIAGFDLSTA